MATTPPSCIMELCHQRHAVLQVQVAQFSESCCRDMADTYLPAFQACVQGGGASSVMCSYNSVRGVPACASRALLQQQLRGQWDFQGVVVSDCGAVQTAFSKHHYKRSGAEALHNV